MTPDQKIAALKKRYQGRIKIALQKTARQLVQPIIDVIKLRTRLEGLDSSGKKFDKLSDKYVEQRKRYASNLHPDTDPSTSNLTATGQLVDALQGKAAQGIVTIIVKNTKRKAGLTGSRSGITNNQLRGYLEEQGKEFLKLSPQEKAEVTDLAIQILEEELRGKVI